MPAWNTADLLTLFKEKVRLPDANEYDDATSLCPRASRAQLKVYNKITAIYPNCLYSAPFAMTPSVDRKTFSFGVDGSSNPVVPLGKAMISPSISAITSGDFAFPWAEGQQYIDEGTQIRIIGNRAYGNTLYCRGVITPPDITLVVPPTLQPASARDLIAIQMGKDWAADGNGSASLGQRMDQQWKEEFPTTMLTLRRRFAGGGAGYDPIRWWLGAPGIAGASTT